jgi:probable DNA metabolism protein
MGVMNDLLTNDLFPQALLPVTLQGQADFEGFRRAARSLLAQNILPEQVRWQCGSTPAKGAEASGTALSDAPAVSVPPEYVALCEVAVMHSNPQRFNLLYRLLWRLVHEPGLRHNQLDPDMALARQMAEEVRHDMQKMKAQLRFHSVQDDTFKTRPQGGPLHVAWFEPEHHIMGTVAPLFAKRFAHMRWAILTPECSVEWNGGQLLFGPGGTAAGAPPPDAREQLWLSYYQHIFGLARVKRQTMQKGTPRKYRKNPPEAELTYPAGSRRPAPRHTPGRASHAAHGAR